MSQAQPRPRRSRRDSSRGAVVTDLHNLREERQSGREQRQSGRDKSKPGRPKPAAKAGEAPRRNRRRPLLPFALACAPP